MPSRWFHRPLLNLALALGLTSLVAHAAVTPIPQRFKQEVALHRSITNGLPTGPIQLVDSGPADTVRALINGHWYARRNGSWSADPSFDPPSDAEFAFAGSDGKPRTVKTPWAGVRQFIHHGAVGAGRNVEKFQNLGWERVPGIFDRLKDQGIGEDLLRGSGVPYTIIRNARLYPPEAPATGKAALTEDDSIITPMTRADLAKLTLSCVANAACLNKTFHVQDASLPWPMRRP